MLFCLLSIWPAGSAWAHRVNVYAWIERETVHTESYFPGGKKVKNGKISVLDAQGQEILAGHTDEQGLFSFKIPVKSEMKIVLMAGQAHRAEWRISAAEIEKALQSSGLSERPKNGGKPNGPTVKHVAGGLFVIAGLTGLVLLIKKMKKKE